MNKYSFIFFLSIILVTCKPEEEEAPQIVVFAARQEPFVLNLKRLIPFTKTYQFEISAPQHGTIRLAAQSEYLIYEPNSNFVSDILTVTFYVINATEPEFIRVAFVEADIGCVPLARSYELETTASSTLTKSLLTFFCDENLVSRVTSFTQSDDGIDGVELIMTHDPPLVFSYYLYFTAQYGAPDFGEIIYEVGADEAGFNGQPFEAKQSVAGLIKIKVTK